VVKNQSAFPAPGDKFINSVSVKVCKMGRCKLPDSKCERGFFFGKGRIFRGAGVVDDREGEN